MFSCEFCKIFKIIFFTEHIREIASEFCDMQQKSEERAAVDSKKDFGCFFQRLKAIEVLDK